MWASASASCRWLVARSLSSLRSSLTSRLWVMMPIIRPLASRSGTLSVLSQPPVPSGRMKRCSTVTGTPCASISSSSRRKRAAVSGE